LDEFEDQVAAHLEELGEDERLCFLFGLAVKDRFLQVERHLRGMPPQIIAGIAAEDIWTVLSAESDDPLHTLADYLQAEDALL